MTDKHDAVEAMRFCWRLGVALRGIARNCAETEAPIGALVGLYRYVAACDGAPAYYVCSLLTATGAVDPRCVTLEVPPEALDRPEPGIARWHESASRLAEGEGWDVFTLDPPIGTSSHQLESYETDSRFSDDEDVWEHVWKRAVDDDCPLAQQALGFLYYRVPEEYEAIRAHCTAQPQEQTHGT